MNLPSNSCLATKEIHLDFSISLLPPLQPMRADFSSLFVKSRQRIPLTCSSGKKKELFVSPAKTRPCCSSGDSQGLPSTSSHRHTALAGLIFNTQKDCSETGAQQVTRQMVLGHSDLGDCLGLSYGFSRTEKLTLKWPWLLSLWSA